MELVRYIHLNPIRARLVENLKALNKYPYAGQSAIMGKRIVPWQDTDKVLLQFGSGKGAARKKYLSFVEKGLSQGRRSDLIGGGMVRSAGGWGAQNDAEALEMAEEGITEPGKHPVRVQARGVAAYWAVRHLSISGVEMGKKLDINQSAISRAVKRGENLVRK